MDDGLHLTRFLRNARRITRLDAKAGDLHPKAELLLALVNTEWRKDEFFALQVFQRKSLRVSKGVVGRNYDAQPIVAQCNVFDPLRFIPSRKADEAYVETSGKQTLNLL